MALVSLAFVGPVAAAAAVVVFASYLLIVLVLIVIELIRWNRWMSTVHLMSITTDGKCNTDT